MKRWVLPVAVAATLLMGGWASQAQAAGTWNVAQAGTQEKEKVRFATVMINDKEVLRLAETKDLTAEERANEVQKRLNMVLKPQKGQSFKPVQMSEIVVTPVTNQPVIRFRNQNVIDVTPEDARLNGVEQQALAQRWASELRGALHNIKVATGKTLPTNTITVATGQMEVPKSAAGKSQGGGAGTGGKGSPKPHQRP